MNTNLESNIYRRGARESLMSRSLLQNILLPLVMPLQQLDNAPSLINSYPASFEIDSFLLKLILY
jgi:hypothetical protein